MSSVPLLTDWEIFLRKERKKQERAARAFVRRVTQPQMPAELLQLIGPDADVEWLLNLAAVLSQLGGLA